MVQWSPSVGMDTYIFHCIPFVLPSTYLISMAFKITAEVAADTEINLLMEVEEIFVCSIHAHPGA